MARTFWEFCKDWYHGSIRVEAGHDTQELYRQLIKELSGLNEDLDVIINCMGKDENGKPFLNVKHKS